MLSSHTLFSVQNTLFALFGTSGEEASSAQHWYTTGLAIVCLLPFGMLSFKLTLQKRTDRAGEGDVWLGWEFVCIQLAEQVFYVRGDV